MTRRTLRLRIPFVLVLAFSRFFSGCGQETASHRTTEGPVDGNESPITQVAPRSFTDAAPLGARQLIGVRVVGDEEVVSGRGYSTTNSCGSFPAGPESAEAEVYVPDGPPRAYRNKDGRSVLIVPHHLNYSFIGSSLDDVKIDCRKPTFRSQYLRDVSRFRDAAWIWSPYRLPNGEVFALYHHEYHANEHRRKFPGDPAFGNCDVAPPNGCWYAGLTAGMADDSGLNFGVYSHIDHVVAKSPLPFVADKAQAKKGYSDPTNVTRSPIDGLYYAIALFTTPTPSGHTEHRNCVLRARDIKNPSDWETFFEGTWRKTQSGANCSAVMRDGDELPGSLNWSPALGRFIFVGFAHYSDLGRRNQAFTVRVSEAGDLTQWSRPMPIAGFFPTWHSPDADFSAIYSSLIDEGGGDNYDVVGRSPWLYYIRNVKNADYREVRRVRIRLDLADVNMPPTDAASWRALVDATYVRLYGELPPNDYWYRQTPIGPKTLEESLLAYLRNTPSYWHSLIRRAAAQVYGETWSDSADGFTYWARQPAMSYEALCAALLDGMRASSWGGTTWAGLVRRAHMEVFGHPIDDVPEGVGYWITTYAARDRMSYVDMVKRLTNDLRTASWGGGAWASLVRRAHLEVYGHPIDDVPEGVRYWITAYAARDRMSYVDMVKRLTNDLRTASWGGGAWASLVRRAHLEVYGHPIDDVPEGVRYWITAYAARDRMSYVDMVKRLTNDLRTASWGGAAWASLVRRAHMEVYGTPIEGNPEGVAYWITSFPAAGRTTYAAHIRGLTQDLRSASWGAAAWADIVARGLAEKGIALSSRNDLRIRFVANRQARDRVPLAVLRLELRGVR